MNKVIAKEASLHFVAFKRRDHRASPRRGHRVVESSVVSAGINSVASALKKSGYNLSLPHNLSVTD